MPDELLILKDIRLEIGSFKLSIDSLKIKAKEKVCLFGPNGSGKTTLAKVMTGYLKPQEGKIYVNGKNINDLKPEERSGLITYSAFDQSVVYSEKKLVDFIKLGAFNRKDDGLVDKEIDFLLKIFNLDNHLTQVISTLSAGELQRAIIVQTLLLKPKIIIFDEPTAHLDIYWQANLMSAIDRYSYGFLETSIYILHDLNLALNNFQRIICLSNGEIALDLKIKDIKDRFKACREISRLYGLSENCFEYEGKTIFIYF